ncbi:hypothetical protein ACOME3_000331 [Neoechinorhynchus agilis]
MNPNSIPPFQPPYLPPAPYADLYNAQIRRHLQFTTVFNQPEMMLPHPMLQMYQGPTAPFMNSYSGTMMGLPNLYQVPYILTPWQEYPRANYSRNYKVVDRPGHGPYILQGLNTRHHATTPGQVDNLITIDKTDDVAIQSEADKKTNEDDAKEAKKGDTELAISAVASAPPAPAQPNAKQAQGTPRVGPHPLYLEMLERERNSGQQKTDVFNRPSRRQRVQVPNIPVPPMVTPGISRPDRFHRSAVHSTGNATRDFRREIRTDSAFRELQKEHFNLKNQVNTLKREIAEIKALKKDTDSNVITKEIPRVTGKQGTMITTPQHPRQQNWIGPPIRRSYVIEQPRNVIMQPHLPNVYCGPRPGCFLNPQELNMIMSAHHLPNIPVMEQYVSETQVDLLKPPNSPDKAGNKENAAKAEKDPEEKTKVENNANL